jgi:thiol-disulfide isomerase/thioredoxin
MRSRKLLSGMTIGIAAIALATAMWACEQPAAHATAEPSAPATTAPIAKAPASQPAGGIELKDVDGTVRRPLDLQGAAGAVILFIASDCPISNGYAPEINRICEQYGGEGAGKFRFYLVHVDPDFKPEDARKHAKDYGFTCPVLMDGGRTLCKALAATVTPEAFVIGEGGKVLYKGRIDDKWAGYLKSRAEATTHDLRAALDAVRAGKPVPTPKTEAVGCPIG